MNFPQYNRVVAVSAHPDDAEIGCGGALARLASNGCKITNVILTASELVGAHAVAEIDDRWNEAVESAHRLGMGVIRPEVFFPHRRLSEKRADVLDYLCKIHSVISPDLVFLPSSHDAHQDHLVAYQEGNRAFKDCTVLGYEMPWNNAVFNSTLFVSLRSADVFCKNGAIHAYQSQKEKPYTNPEFIVAWARLRGVQSGFGLAEGFEVLRCVWK